MTKLGFAEYIWLDGGTPTQGLRSKARVISVPSSPVAADFPIWSFDGSSTGQAEGEDSDCFLEPVCVVADPKRGVGSYLVLCEVMNPDGTPHDTNHRAALRSTLAKAGDEAPWAGFEQEYTIYRDGRPLGFPENGYPRPQGPYYCSVGADVAYGRNLADAHAASCLDAGIMIYGINAEVMPGQWEFQIGPRGIDAEPADALTMSDHVWLARFLLQREAERFGYVISFSNKPMAGDWNGAGMHTNFSTAATRSQMGGRKAIKAAVTRLGNAHDKHIAEYGADLASRLTGLHETCSILDFRSGIAHRGASIRIPQPVARKGYGYFEDRRPGANADPYRVVNCLVDTVCCAQDAVPQVAQEAV
ncbi:glutamine synthetase beta-grasp domain-containing protein [Roseovarius indicus]|uniref:Glutamine synthetase n=1 Tax=Roseovarius indicus TaxID=540747 RepID=A0A0T5PDP9_9RHOB|nr:glutamine synthetase beta-grasp domain-containing protein [Roseovarius indicus]KRS19201.1 glutamine synthetase [Roseovarius indicus]QEW25834.1 Glutamine synthetase 2 [Roseovarius indicus]SFD89054.1 L-glutamine synthetase [Roseovarius indicus]